MGIRRVVRNLYFLSLGYGEGFVGLVIAVSTVFGILIALPSGKISDYFGRIKALFLGISLAVIGVALQATVSKATILIGASLHRMGIGMIFIAGPALLAEHSEGDERTHLFSFYDGIRRLSIFIGAIAGGYLPGYFGKLIGIYAEHPLSYRFTLLFQALVILLALIPIFFMKKNPGKKEKDLREKDKKKSLLDFTFSQRGLPRKIIIPTIIIGGGAGFIFPFMNVIFKHFGASTQTIGWIFSVESIVSGLATFSIPYIATKLGKVKGITILRSISIPFLLIIGFSGHIPIMAFALWIRSSLMRMGMPLRKNIMMDVTVFKDRSKINSLYQVAFRSGMSITSFVAGWIYANLSYSLPFLITTTFYVFGIYSFYKYFKPLEEGKSSE